MSHWVQSSGGSNPHSESNLQRRVANRTVAGLHQVALGHVGLKPPLGSHFCGWVPGWIEEPERTAGSQQFEASTRLEVWPVEGLARIPSWPAT